MKLEVALFGMTLAFTGVVTPATADQLPQLLRGGRELQGKGNQKPSQVITEDGDPDPNPENDCTLLAADLLLIDPDGRRLEGDEGGGGPDDMEFDCGFPDGTVASMSGLAPSQRAGLISALTSGAATSGNSRIDLAAAGATKNGGRVTFPPGFDVAGSARSKGRGQGKVGGAGRSSPDRRRLAQLVGNKYTLVVKGKFLDYLFDGKAATVISDDVFGTYGDSVTMASQLEDCSYGKLVTVPGPDPSWNGGAFTSLDGIEEAPGVLEIEMGVNMAGMTKSAIYNLFVEKTVEALGAAVTALPGPFDHVMFARETCLTECGWAAYAYINSWGQMYQGNYISLPGVTMHEMGHNLNFAHSGSPGTTSWSGGTVPSGGYTDHTCIMGNPLYSDDVGKMCFNPAKNYQIDGWYNDAKLTLDPGGINGPIDLPWTGDLVGVGEYDLRAGAEPVTVKIETGTPQDLFVGFNRAAGPNADNDLADDKVTVIQVEGNNGVGYSQSQLIGILDTSEAYSELSVPGIVDYANLKIRVNSFDTSTAPWKANVGIGFDECVDNPYCQSLAGGCYDSTCEGQGALGAKVNGCVDSPKPNCCGNDVCEGTESAGTCGVDCVRSGTVQPDDCSGCWIRDGAMFDVEAKPDADVTILGIEYKAYTNTGNVRLYYRPGGRAGYSAGTSLTANGWVFVKQAAACGSWTYCTLGSVSISVPRGTRVGLLVAYDNGGDVLYYNNNYGSTTDDYVTVHEGSAVNYNLAGDYADSFHNVLMFSGKVTYEADLTNPFQCATNEDCDDGVFCNGAETCDANSCVSGANTGCSGATPFCSEPLASCVACLSDGDCTDDNLCNGVETCNTSGQCVAGTTVECDDGVACTVDFCTPETGQCTNSPDNFRCDNGFFCDGAETCDAVAGCQTASDPCSGATPFCNETLDQCLECQADGDCEDGDLCNGAETCNAAGQCANGPAIDCDDGVGCTVDECDATDGSCSNIAADSLCNDSLFCNGVETCSAVSDCIAGTPPPCPNLCSEALTSCVQCFADENCDDGTFCNGAEVCNNAGQCGPGNPPACSEPTPFCAEALGQCAECLSVGDCDDGVACTDDACAGGACSSTPNDTNCPSGETCDAQAGCQAAYTVYACAKNAPAQADACVAASDAACEADPLANCGKGGKVCHEFTCSGTPPATTTTEAPPGCQVGGSCSGKCTQCCYGFNGSGGSKFCNNAP